MGAGCKAENRGSRFQDLSGRRFGRLVAIEPTGDHSSDGCCYWLCKCDCGNMSVANSHKLLHGRTTSCGCYRRECLETSRTFVGGTCLEIIRSENLLSNNTSGAKGVSLSRGLWLAKISFARRQFFLGRFASFDAAAAMVKLAEELRAEVVDDIDNLQDKAVDVLASRLELLKESFDATRYSAKRAMIKE